MDNELILDPFTRRQTGRHGAFLLRTNTAHLETCLEAIHDRRLREVAVQHEDGTTWTQA